MQHRLAIRYIFDIPVYRLPSERYYLEMDVWINQRLYGGTTEHAQMMRSFYERHPDQKLLITEHLLCRYGGSWQYNEIVGHIRLHFLGSQIRGEYFGAKAKRIVRTRRRLLEYRTHKLAPEVDVPGGSTSTAIYSLILQYLEDCRKELKPSYLDISLLEAIGPFVDWSGLYRAA